jgi:hypothetical protein
MAGRLNKKKKNAKNVICGIFQNSNWGWESRTDKAESAAGLSFKKKTWNFAQWQTIMVTDRQKDRQTYIHTDRQTDRCCAG